jgi:DNA-binding FrmR family transcriptional regulator
VRRLARIEGQVRGLQRMLGEDRACIDILTQIAAARAALDKVALAVLDDRLRRTLPDVERERIASEILEVVARVLRTG